MYIFRVTNRIFAGLPFRSVSQRVYIFISTGPVIYRVLAIPTRPIRLPGYIPVANMRFRAGSYIASINTIFKDKDGKAVPTRNGFAIINKYKLPINNIRSMEVNPFIRKLDSFFKGKGVFFSVR